MTALKEQRGRKIIIKIKQPFLKDMDIHFFKQEKRLHSETQERWNN